MCVVLVNVFDTVRWRSQSFHFSIRISTSYTCAATLVSTGIIGAGAGTGAGSSAGVRVRAGKHSCHNDDHGKDVVTADHHRSVKPAAPGISLVL